VCARCGQEIPRGEQISSLRLFGWTHFHETCAEQEGVIDADEFGWPLRGPKPPDDA
jgi:hypothetical protein